MRRYRTSEDLAVWYSKCPHFAQRFMCKGAKMRRFSYLLGSCALVALLLSMGSMAKADTVDPAIGVRGCTGGGCSIIVGPGGTFSTTFFGGVAESDFGFINHTGQNVVELDLLATSLRNTPLLTYTCVMFSEYFTNCSVTPNGDGSTLIRYFAPNNGEGGVGGIPNDPCGDGCGSVPAADAQLYVTGTDFAALKTDQGFTADVTLLAAPVPEPGTIILLGSGLGALGLRRLRRGKKTS
jgi:PEP-CTERM motif